MNLLKNSRQLYFKLFFILFSLISVQGGFTETFHVGLYPNPPYIFPENSVNPGITVEIINRIADQKNFKIIYHYNTYEAGLDLLSIGMIDLLPVFNSRKINMNFNPYFIQLKKESLNKYSDSAARNLFIPCLLTKDSNTASAFTGRSLYSQIVPLIHPFKDEAAVSAGVIIDRYRPYLFPYYVKKHISFFLFIVVIALLLSSLAFIHLPAIKSISRTGRKIISEVESPDFFPFINKNITGLIKFDYFCIGDFDNNTLNLNIFSRGSSILKEKLNESINQNDSCFIYSVRNRKPVYIKNCKKDFKKFVSNNLSLKNIDSNLKSVFIFPLLLNNELQGAAAVLSRRRNAFPFVKRCLLRSISKYISISLKNRKLINSNRELLLCIENDKNQILKAKQEVEYLAQHDPLTNLPNRLYLNEFLSQSIKKSNRTGKKLAVLFIDMDNFKEVNDTYGHQTGDKVLIAASKRFKNLLRESDLVIRFGGDEFIIILEDVNSSDDIKQVANKIINTCTAPVLTESADLSLSFSIGVSMYPDNGNSADELIRKADIALYDVKNNVKGKWKFYSEKDN